MPGHDLAPCVRQYEQVLEIDDAVPIHVEKVRNQSAKPTTGPSGGAGSVASRHDATASASEERLVQLMLGRPTWSGARSYSASCVDQGEDGGDVRGLCAERIMAAFRWRASDDLPVKDSVIAP